MRGQWFLFGGKREGDEGLEQTASREAKEEINMDVHPTQWTQTWQDGGMTGGNWLLIDYAIELTEQQLTQVNFNPDSEHVSKRWYTLGGVQELSEAGLAGDRLVSRVHAAIETVRQQGVRERAWEAVVGQGDHGPLITEETAKVGEAGTVGADTNVFGQPLLRLGVGSQIKGVGLGHGLSSSPFVGVASHSGWAPRVAGLWVGGCQPQEYQGVGRGVGGVPESANLDESE